MYLSCPKQEDDGARGMIAARTGCSDRNDTVEKGREQEEEREAVDNDQCLMDFAESLSDSANDEGRESEQLMMASSSSSRSIICQCVCVCIHQL